MQYMYLILHQLSAKAIILNNIDRSIGFAVVDLMDSYSPNAVRSRPMNVFEGRWMQFIHVLFCLFSRILQGMVNNVLCCG